MFGETNQDSGIKWRRRCDSGMTRASISYKVY